MTCCQSAFLLNCQYLRISMQSRCSALYAIVKTVCCLCEKFHTDTPIDNQNICTWEIIKSKHWSEWISGYRQFHVLIFLLFHFCHKGGIAKQIGLLKLTLIILFFCSSCGLYIFLFTINNFFYYKASVQRSDFVLNLINHICIFKAIDFNLSLFNEQHLFKFRKQII